MRIVKSIFPQVRTVIYAMAAVFSMNIIISCDSLATSSKDNDALEFLAVKKDAKANWSIIDHNGNIVVNQEYASTDTISKIYENGVYWVRSGEKTRLFSINSPKKAISEEEYDDVTDFACGRAFASKLGEPIILIGEDGKHIKTLDRNIVEACAFSDGLAVFKSSNGLHGYLDKNGDVVIEAQYDFAGAFHDGYAVTIPSLKEKNYTQVIINKKNEISFSVKKEMYDLGFVYRDGKFVAIKNTTSNDPLITYLNEKGDEVLKPMTGYNSMAESFRDGFAVLSNYEESQKSSVSGVINANGEEVIRKGKYNPITNLGEGLFLVMKSDEKVGVVDKDDNTVVPLEYTDGSYLRLGDFFILQSGKYWLLVNRKGEEVKKSEFTSYSAWTSDYVKFVDVKAHIDNFLKPITSKGYAPFKGHLDAAGITKEIGIKLDSVELYTSDLKMTKTATPLSWETVTELYFTDPLKTAKYREVTTNDGWFENTETVEDGYEWNPESKLWKVFLSTVVADVKMNDVKKLIAQSLKAKGFKQDSDDDEIFDARFMGRTIRIIIYYNDTLNQVNLLYYPDWTE